MAKGNFKRAILIMAASFVASSIVGAAQTESIWQKIKKSAAQTGQNTAQQGTQQVQQKIQQQVPGATGQTNQTTQPPCGSLTGGGGAAGATLNNASYSGSGGAGTNFATGSCGQQCFNAGPFAAAVTQMTMSQQGYYHIIRMNVQFHNSTDQPLIIAYRDGSMVMVDNLGNTYQAAGGNPGALQGMGIDRGNQTDSQFVLSPGQTGNAMFSVARARGNDSAIGTAYTYNLTVDELQAQNGAQAIAVRQYNLNFPTLAPGGSNASFPAPAAAPGSLPVSNVAAGGASKGSAVGASAAQAVPVSRAVRSARVPVQAAPTIMSNAALKSNSAAAAKPAAAVKAVPAKVTDKKAATTQTNSTTNSK